MIDFLKLYINSYMILIIVSCLILIHYNNKEKNKIQDINNDGIINEYDIKYHIQKELDVRTNQPPRIKGLVKSSLSGMIRGLVIGYFLGGYDLAIVNGLVMAGVNPIMSIIEHNI